LGEMKGMLKEVVESEKEEPVAVVVPVEVVDDTEKIAAENREAGRVARLQAQGEELASLTTASGEEYYDLVINRVTDIGVVFRHRGGVARVAFTDLSAAWQERFYFDADLAILAEENERLAQIRYERAAGARLAAMAEEKEEAAEALSLARLAQAVEGLNHRNAVPETVVREQIYVEPPLIMNQYRDYRSEIYCPPLVTPQIIRTPSTGTLGVIAQVRPSNYCPPPARPTVLRPTVKPTPVRPTTSRPTPIRPSTSRPSISRPSPVRPPSPSPAPVRPSTSRPATSLLR
jgi:hypothetical protein